MRIVVKLCLLATACLALVLFLIGATPPQAAAPPVAPSPAPQSALVQGPPVARLAFTVHNGLISLPVRINGSKELRMYLDTGMSAPVVVLFHKESLTELALKGTQPALIAGAGEQDRRPATMAPGATVAVGGLVMANQTLVILAESRVDSDWPVDGIIGKSLFDKYLTEIDYVASTVTFYDPAQARVEAPSAPIPLDLADGMPVVRGAVDIAGGGKVELRLVVDLGHRNALSLNEDAAKGVMPPKRTVGSIAGRGIQGEIPGTTGRVKTLVLGSYALSGIPADFLAPGVNPGVSRAKVDGNVGTQALNRFTVVLDYAGKRMFLVPNADFGKPFPFNQAGLVLEQDREGVYVVRHVIADSPASKAGIEKGDRVTAIDGTDVRRRSYREVLEAFSHPGRRLRLTVERDGSLTGKTVRLGRLI